MRNALLGLGWVMLVGCAGKAPPNQVNPDSSIGIDGSMIDAGSAASTAKVSGKVMDYFTGDPLAAAAVTTDGLTPALAVVSGADGSYSMDVAVGSKLFADTSHANFRTSRSSIITVADVDLTENLYALASADVTRQFSSVGVTAASGTIVAIDVQKDNGDPFPGLALTAITLVDPNNLAVTGVAGPFFFGAAGDLDLAVITSTAYGAVPKTRAAFLNVPPGSYTVITTFNDGAARTYKTPIIVDAGGATITLSGGANANLTAVSTVLDPSFATDIYPRLQKASIGGLGCGNCHTANGLAAVLPYDNADPAVTLAAIKAAAGVINATTPAASLFLTKPLYETTPPQNHANATFLDVNDPSYKLFLVWITNGTKP
ncbi:MAG TPA: hypothetical protein VF403_06840 [Kofleriaceae bacterium]